MSSISDVFAAGLEQVRKSWGWFLVLGILLAALGVLCVVKSQTATTFSILALGWVIAISGVLWLVNSIWAWSWQGFFEKGAPGAETHHLPAAIAYKIVSRAECPVLTVHH